MFYLVFIQMVPIDVLSKKEHGKYVSSMYVCTAILSVDREISGFHDR